MASPIISSLVMLGGGDRPAVRDRRQPQQRASASALLLLMTGLLGWWLGPILNVALSMKNGMALVGYAAVGTGIDLLRHGRARRRPSSATSRFMGKFLFVGMIALLVAMIANMFLQIPALALTISTLVIVVFSLFLLYDLQRIMRGGETNYVMATTGVYMSLFNIFANLLHLLLGARRRARLSSLRPRKRRLRAPFLFGQGAARRCRSSTPRCRWRPPACPS